MKDGQSALMFAAKGKHIQVLDYLLSLGANINNADKVNVEKLIKQIDVVHESIELKKSYVVLTSLR